jgi:hypothetical protein
MAQMSGATAAAVFLATTGVSILAIATALLTTCTILSKIRYRNPPVLTAVESEERT